MAMALANRLSLLLAAACAVAPAGAQHAVHNRDVAVRDPRDTSLHIRATDEAPNAYVPASVDCPDDRPKIRDGAHLGPDETAWLLKRRNETIPHIRDLLKRFNIPGFDSDKYLEGVDKNATALPNIGLAISGGGYRAMLNGAGAISAWDGRTPGSDAQGNLGGLLQSATYLSGLSGGAWLVGSLFTNNFTTVQASVESPIIWQFENSILEGPEQYSIWEYYKDILENVEDKDKAGYDRSITDYWGRMLSYQLVNTTDGGPGYTFSSIADDPDFSAGKAPMPLIVADSRPPGVKIVSLNSTLFEFTPWELGSSDPTLRGFVPLKYVGSKFDGGVLPKDAKCVRGFDNAGFVMGTSSTLFNQIVTYLKDPNQQYVPDDVPDFFVKALTSFLTALGDDNDDIADWTPNPFKGFNDDVNLSADSNRLTLVDGGEDLQNIPYHPHLHIERKVDVVFSVDSSFDTTYGWPNGASAIATYERSLETIANGTGFPVVPGQNTFLNQGLNTKPVFFGCNATNTTDASPLIVYIPNYPYLYQSNISTFQMSTAVSERDAIIENGWAVATQLNSTRDANWPVCVGCAILARSFHRTNATVPDACQKCFQTYCWDGKLDESEPGVYDPAYYSDPIKVDESAGLRLAGRPGVAVALAAAMGVLLAS